MRRPSEEADAALSSLVDAAVERGIIDTLQRDKLRALSAELAVPHTHAPLASAPLREARRGFNAVTVAYSLGALLVLFALGWFLFDRWTTLGPTGVLGVSVLYAAAFAGAGVLLRRRGFEVAGGLAIVLAVSMTPVWTWAILRLTGALPNPNDWDNALSRYEPYIATRIIVAELATLGVALVAVRRVNFFALAAPMAVAFVALLLHLGQALGDPRLAWYVGGYYDCVVGCATLAVAYAIDRRQPRGEDFAFWFYLAGVVMLVVGYAQVWSYIGAWRHALPLVALALVTASLYLRRRTLVIAGGFAAFGYLAYLAFDVFRRVVALPVALATLGLVVIAATVWMQRRFPALVARVSGEDGAGERVLPVWPAAVLGPLAIALTAMIFAVSEAKIRTSEQDWRNSLYQRRIKNQQRVQKLKEQREGAASSQPQTREGAGSTAPQIGGPPKRP